MTRFARAKGSKASNEKQPEEATSWLDMKNAMLLKHSHSPQNISEVKEQTCVSKPVEWATFDVDQSLGNVDSGENKQATKKKKIKKKLKVPCSQVQEKNEISEEKCQNTKFNCHEEDGGKKKRKRKLKDTDLTCKKEEKAENGDLKKPLKKRIIEPECQQIITNNEKSEQKEIFQKKKGKNNLKQESDNKIGNKFEFSNWREQKFNKKFKNKKFNNFLNKRSHFERSFKQDNSVVDEIIVNGEKIPIVKFQGFHVTQEDAERLKKLRSDMIKEGIPKDRMESAIKLERRRAEKALSRLKKAVCFHCRGPGHLLSSCPALVDTTSASTGICYKCGSTEHSALECKVVKGSSYQFAECFICKEQGHIARQCPDNPRGLYPQGGACRDCGDVTHLRKDCPQNQSKKAEAAVTVGVRSDRNLESLEEELIQKENLPKKNKKDLTIKF